MGCNEASASPLRSALNRYSLAFVGISLILGFCGFILAAFSTKDWRYLIGAAACWALVSASAEH